ncbi:hypothetical protein D9615_009741 [Tricholomella constricta]|uniref:DNA 3'-5' helicase n=1 Tax=Tricholomella constricta TaxID=117010 RepID=A0A8H5GT23_9AGAR|nr:hypothetical protein D9615_009741 [Tricholomella constricta]
MCINATGGGKSGLIYIPAIARKDMIILVIEPTNFLEHDMARNLGAKGVTAIAINAEAQETALRAGRNLWAEAQDCRYQVITISPESLRSSEFDKLLADPTFYKRWGLLVVDEVHLIDEWGRDFRPLYQDIWSVRSRGPDGLVVVALSATVEPGHQTDAIIRHLGFRKGKYFLDRRDCERHNIDFIFRDIEFSFTGQTFRDLDWLIPPGLKKASDVPKCLVYCETIEMGHRMVTYLRSLLPPPLKQHAHTVIRHMHSLNCPDCKSEGLAALYESGDARTTALFVTTAILEVGIDVPDIESVVMFPAPLSASSLVQRSGRPARGRGMHGKAIIHVKKTELELARNYVEMNPADPRLLQSENSTSTPTIPTPAPVDAPLPAPSPGVPTQSLTVSSPLSKAVSTSKIHRPAAKKNPPKSSASRQPCSALLLVIGAHLRGLCITLQINMIYHNPNTSHNCGRCSSCIPQPRPRARVSSTSSSVSSQVPIMLQRPAFLPAPTTNDSTDSIKAKLPGHRKLTQKDSEEISNRLIKAAHRILYSSMSSAPYTLFISPKCFLPPHFIKAITTDLYLITTEAILKDRLEGWRYWDTCGQALWTALSTITFEIAALQDKRHAISLSKRRAVTQLKVEERVRAQNIANGLGHIKRVKLVLSGPSEATLLEPRAVETHAMPPDRTQPTHAALPHPTINFPHKKRTLLSASSRNTAPPKVRRQTNSDTAPSVARSLGKENYPGPGQSDALQQGELLKQNLKQF